MAKDAFAVRRDLVRVDEHQPTSPLLGEAKMSSVTSRNNDGFDALFEAEYQSVVRAAQVIVGDPELARDIAQEAFTKLFVHWKRVSNYDIPGAWVRRVAVNRAMSAAAKTRGRRAAETFFKQRTIEGASPRECLDDDIVAALLDLSPQQRAAICLFYLEDRPVSEVATLMGTTESTVKAHLQRARRRLAQGLHREVPDATS